MTKDKFKQLCEQVLFPRFDDLVHVQLADLHMTLDILAQEIVRIGDRVDEIADQLPDRDDDEDNG